MVRSSLSIVTQKPFHIILPQVYRYMDEQYINDFFEKGILRLSSFQTYKDYEDIIRGDKGEGSNLAVAQNLEQNRSMGVYTTIGLNSYSLCASLIYSEDLQKVFNCNSAFMIKDVMSYSIAVGDSILRLREIFQGCCSYVDQRITIVEHPDLSLESLRVSPESDNIYGKNDAKSTRDYPT